MRSFVIPSPDGGYVLGFGFTHAELEKIKAGNAGPGVFNSTLSIDGLVYHQVGEPERPVTELGILVAEDEQMLADKMAPIIGRDTEIGRAEKA